MSLVDGGMPVYGTGIPIEFALSNPKPELPTPEQERGVDRRAP